MNNNTNYARRMLKVTAKSKDGSSHGIPYPLPIHNPVWLYLESIVNAYRSKMVEITVHCGSSSKVMDDDLYKKFAEMGYVTEADLVGPVTLPDDILIPETNGNPTVIPDDKEIPEYEDIIPPPTPDAEDGEGVTETETVKTEPADHEEKPEEDTPVVVNENNTRKNKNK